MAGFIGKILRSFIEDGIREIALELYEGYPIQSRNVAPPGIDSAPIPSDQGVGSKLDNSNGKTIFFGVYPDSKSDDGELRIYSRDSDDNIKSELWLKKDGKHYFNGGSNEAARKDDKTEINISTDATLIAWIANVHAALQSSPANGIVTASLPDTLTGKITEGTDEVLLP